jgi:hypothetical protein
MINSSNEVRKSTCYRTSAYPSDKSFWWERSIPEVRPDVLQSAERRCGCGAVLGDVVDEYGGSFREEGRGKLTPVLF